MYIKYLCDSVPREYMGTLQGFLHGVYWGLGKYLAKLLNNSDTFTLFRSEYCLERVSEGGSR